MATDEENGEAKVMYDSELSLEDPYKAHIIYSEQELASSDESEDFTSSDESTVDSLEALEAVQLPVLSVSQRFGHLITGQLSKLRQDVEFTFPAHTVLKDDETQTDSVEHTSASTNSENEVVDLTDVLQMQSTIRTLTDILTSVVQLSKIVSSARDATKHIVANRNVLEEVRAKCDVLEKDIGDQIGHNVSKAKRTEVDCRDQRTEMNSMNQRTEVDSSDQRTNACFEDRRLSPTASICRLSGLLQQARDSEGLSRDTEKRQGQGILVGDMMNILSVVREMINDITYQMNSMTANECKTIDIGVNTVIDHRTTSRILASDGDEVEKPGSRPEDVKGNKLTEKLPEMPTRGVERELSLGVLASFYSALSHFSSESSLDIVIPSKSRVRDGDKAKTCVGVEDTISAGNLFVSESDHEQETGSPFGVKDENVDFMESKHKTADELGDHNLEESCLASVGSRGLGQGGFGSQDSIQTGAGDKDSDQARISQQRMSQTCNTGQESDQKSIGDQEGMVGRDAGQADFAEKELGHEGGDGGGLNQGGVGNGGSDTGCVGGGGSDQKGGVRSDSGQEGAGGGSFDQEGVDDGGSGQVGVNNSGSEQRGVGIGGSGQVGNGGGGSDQGCVGDDGSDQERVGGGGSDQGGVGGQGGFGGISSDQGGVGDDGSDQEGVGGGGSDQRGVGGGGSDQGGVGDGGSGQEGLGGGGSGQEGGEGVVSGGSGQEGVIGGGSGKEGDACGGSGQASVGSIGSDQGGVDGSGSDQGGDGGGGSGFDDSFATYDEETKEEQGSIMLNGQNPCSDDSHRKGRDNDIRDSPKQNFKSSSLGSECDASKETGSASNGKRGKRLLPRPSHSDTSVCTGKRRRLKSILSDGKDKMRNGGKRKSQTNAQSKKSSGGQGLGRRLIQATCAVVSVAGLMGAMVQGPSGCPWPPALVEDMSRIIDLDYL
ncbi:Glutamine-rich protein 2 [Mizuhopecten yessoensis]|uniref:Glutamine-rich protein 2 n=1 Tax=Mizuhopecten yessoensis TaxID=6573 RepID=A0A210Q4U3_MIZYE|nr:Glutamine-rich protein 2 [Mizuhopecten yessoensis]